MTKDQAIEIIRQAVLHRIGKDVFEYSFDKEIVKTDIDSLQLVEISMDIEDAIKGNPVLELKNVKTFNDLVQVVMGYER